METKDKILENTFNLVMKYGIKSVSLDDISRGIGISKKTIYQYFENKKSLISEVIKSFIQKDEKDINTIIDQSKDALDEMALLAKHVLKFLRGMSPSMMFDTQKYYPQVWATIEKQHFTFILETVKTNIKRGQQEGLYQKDVNADITSKLYVRQILALSDESIFPLSEYTRSDLYRNMVTYHMRGIMSEKGRKLAKKLDLD